MLIFEFSLTNFFRRVKKLRQRTVKRANQIAQKRHFDTEDAPPPKKEKIDNPTQADFRFPLFEPLAKTQCQLYQELDQQSKITSHTTDQLRGFSSMSLQKREQILTKLQQDCLLMQASLRTVVDNEVVSLCQYLKDRYKLIFKINVEVDFDVETDLPDQDL